jgi:hypothetical protein
MFPFILHAKFHSKYFFVLAGQVGNVITNRNANRLEFERLLVSIFQRLKNNR